MSSKKSFGSTPWGLIFFTVVCFGGMTQGSVALAGGLLELRGAGATFPAPLYQRWINTFAVHHPNFPISYAAVGSGEGVRRFLAEELDFAGSDAALSDEEMAQVKRGAQLVPATAGIIVHRLSCQWSERAVETAKGCIYGYIPREKSPDGTIAGSRRPIPI